MLLAGCAEPEADAPPIKSALQQIEDAKNRPSGNAAPGETFPGETVAPTADDDIPSSGTYAVEFETTVGAFTIEVNREWAPRGADRFYQLVNDKFFDDCGFFRVVPGFMVQFGIAADPAQHAKWGTEFPDDPVTQSNQRGFVSFATRGPNTRTSQVFINFGDNQGLDAQGFSPFGKVVKGMDVVDKISSAHGESPQQPLIESQGSKYLRDTFPQLDYVKTARIVKKESMAADNE